ncbi:MAG TPA: hypothetical protein VF030_09450 [Solirubrobacterales bacterium]
MSCLIVRCRSCTPASAVELTDWLENKVSGLREGTPRLLVRLTRLAQELPEATVDDGWLIELEVPGERPDGSLTSLMLSLEETLRGMSVLGLDPVLLVPVRPPFGGPIPTSAGGLSS